MNFFQQQAHARRRTSLYVLLFMLATAGIVVAVNLALLGVVWSQSTREHLSFGRWLEAHPQMMLAVSLLALGVIGGASLYRIVSLSSGGSRVATDLGGTLVDTATRDARLRQLLNIVEETAIAAGIPVPQVFVLESEDAINALAAGFTSSDAAIAVTRGALNRLTRDELQGVIGHEFSHILNGDMRLNTRLIGTLFGILVIAFIGRFILNLRLRGSGAAVAVGAGFALLVIGYLGVFFGRLIQAATSRSCESMADASAVQFTRNPAGLAGALKKIAVFSGVIETPHADQVGHMLMAEHTVGFSSFFATHPPILERIRAIEPGFREQELDGIASVDMAELRVLASKPAEVAASAPISVSPQAVVASIGQVSNAALATAASRHAGIPVELAAIARAPTDAIHFAIAMILSRVPAERARQIELLHKHPEFTAAAVARIEALAKPLAELDPVYRLPLFAISFPALRQRQAEELRALATVAEELARSDGEVDVFEYALVRLLRLQLYELMAPRTRVASIAAPKMFSLRAELQALFSVLARAGQDDARAAAKAYARGMSRLLPQAPDYAPSLQWEALDRALVRLDFLAPPMKQELVEALVMTMSYDGRVTLAEAELLRVVCASLHCPLPPLAPQTRP